MVVNFKIFLTFFLMLMYSKNMLFLIIYVIILSFDLEKILMYPLLLLYLLLLEVFR
jgi:hypothetical protein